MSWNEPQQIAALFSDNFPRTMHEQLEPKAQFCRRALDEPGVSSSLSPTAQLKRIQGGNAFLLLTAVATFLWIQFMGEGSFLFAATALQTGQNQSIAPESPTLLVVLGAIVSVIVAARLVGAVFHYFGQPRVIGEIVAGILLGPSLLGRVSPETMHYLFPSTVMPILGVLAQIGVILYMFLVGLELNSGLLKSRAYVTVLISQSSIVIPFLFGAGLALWLYGSFAPEGVSFTVFALFIGVAMAITAFPVLARILSDRGLERTDLGVLALSCAAAGDVIAWCMLAVVVGITKSNVIGAFTTILLTCGFIGIMLGIVQPWLARSLTANHEATQESTGTTWVWVGLLVSALVTEAIGIHAIFGAFLFGAIIPHETPLARSMRRKLEDVIGILLLPIFFACTGMKTEIGLLDSGSAWFVCGVIILVATVGKVGGTMLAARFTGLNWRAASVLGVLMNTRGLMELIVLNIGLELGVITPTLFAMLVLMAIVTTIATMPMLQLLGWSKKISLLN